jgi:abhydrolase domain-containing protein 12
VIPHHHSSTLFSGLSDSTKVNSVGYGTWGNVSTYKRDGGEVLYWDGFRGGHNDIGWAEGSVDLVRRVAGL